jgi:hypothetical protein
MASIREYFDTGGRTLTLHGDWTFSTPAGAVIGSVIAKIAMDFEANAKYWYFYIPKGFNPFEGADAIFSCPETPQCLLSKDGNGTTALVGLHGYPGQISSDNLCFTKRVFLYVDATMSAEERAELTRRGASFGLDVVVRDREYAKVRSEHEKPLAFISHDSRDKDAVVRELAHDLYAVIGQVC